MHKTVQQLIRQGQIAEAQAQADQLLQKNPDNLAAWVAWGACQLAQGTSLPELTARCQEHRHERPRLLAPALYMGLLQRRQNAHAECVATLAPIASAQPRVILNHTRVTSAFVEACLASNNLEHAFRLHEAAETLQLTSRHPVLWRANPAWWSRHQGRSLAFRRTDRSDAAWLKQIFSTPLFAQQVNRNYAGKIARLPVPAISQELDRQANLSPADMGALMLIVEDGQTNRPIGLTSFVSIDPLARQAELIVGFIEEQSSRRIAELSCFLVHLAFERLRFRRVTTSIYSSNPRLSLLKSTLRKFGFQDEGVLRAHAMHGPNHFSDVHLMGGLEEEIRHSEGMKRHGERHGPWHQIEPRFE